MRARKTHRLPLTLQLIVPGLLDRVETWSHASNNFPRFLALETLLTQSQRRHFHHTGYDTVVCALAGVIPEPDCDLPLGALTRYGITSKIAKGFYLAADPVHLRADVQQVILFDAGQLAIKEPEATALVALFNDHFEGRGVWLEMNALQHWHLRLAKPAHIRTHPLRYVMGKSISAYLIEGAHETYWRDLFNEVQMLFHNSPINQAREINGEPTINSLWIYGSGDLPQVQLTEWAAIWADEPMIRGIGYSANLHVQPLPQGLDRLLSEPLPGNHVVSLDSLTKPACYDDISTWCRHMKQLELHWFRPISEAIDNGSIDSCCIHDCAGQSFLVTKAYRWWFKKRPRALTAFIASTQG